MKANKLKPCPFCGSKKYPSLVADYHDGEWGFVVCCQDWWGKGCNAITGYARGFKTKKQAILAWNKRRIKWTP